MAKQAGGKLNDVVLAISSGVVRRYLLERGALPSKSMTAAVPISLREEGNTDANNQVFGMICSIATNVEDPKDAARDDHRAIHQVQGDVASAAGA